MDWEDDFEELSGERQTPKHPGNKKQLPTPEGFPYESVKRAAWAKERADEIGATEATGNFDGKMGVSTPTAWADQFETPEAVSEQGDWTSMFEEEKTPLMSLKGGGSLLRQIGPRIERGLQASKLKFLEQQKLIKEGRNQVALAHGKELPVSEEEIKSTNAEIQNTLNEIQKVDKRLQAARGNPSYPLEIGQEVVANIAENIPGVAFGAATHRELGPLAAVPGLMEAYRSTTSNAYANVRTPDPKTGKPKVESIYQAQTHAETQGDIETVFELTPTSYLLRSLGKTGFGELIRGYLIRDIGTELGTTAVQKIEERISVEPDKPIGEFLGELKDELITTGLVTMISAPLMGAGAYGIGRLGRQRPDEPVELPGRVDPIVEQGAAFEEGAEFTLQTAPKADLATNELPSTAIEQMQTAADAINAEDITEKQLAEAVVVMVEVKAKENRPALADADVIWGSISEAPLRADTGELGASERQAGNAENYINPNQGDRLDRVISYGPEEDIGSTPRQTQARPGTWGIGEVTEDRPDDYMAPLVQSIESLRQKYLPNATIVVSNEQMYNDSALGAHFTSGKGKHLIVPAVLRKPSRGWAAFNPNTIASAFYNMTHEFGHALIADRFYEVDSDETTMAIRQASENGLVPQELIAKLPEQQQAVVAEFNAMKARVLDGSMTAEQFLNEWMGPAKAGRKTFLSKLGVSPKAPAKQLINAIVQLAAKKGRAGGQTNATTTQQSIQEFLGIEEYLAEQVAKFAYQQKWDQTTPLGKFFGSILSGLRGVFIDSKREGIIAPGIAFSDWMEGLGKTPRPIEEKESLSRRRKAMPGKPKVALATKPKRTKKAKAEKPVETVQHNVDSDTTVAKAKEARTAVINLVRTGELNLEDGDYAELMGFIKTGEFEEFREAFTRIAKKTVKFSFDKPKKGRTSKELDVTEENDWSEGKFSSPGFKAFFGDWERDPVGASKVRIGVYRQKAGVISLDNEVVAPPLVLFATAERLRQGANAFHASTPRGQQYVESRSMDSPEDASLLPVVLNIRRPFIQGDLHDPAPSRADLEAQGYDGIVYQNDFDGDLSFVVFRPEQIKVVPDRDPYTGQKGFSLELDGDQSTSEGHTAAKFLNNLKNFVGDPGRLGRSLKHSMRAMRYAMQMQQVAQANPDVNEVQFFDKMNTESNSYNSSRLSLPNKVLDYWGDMSNKSFDKIQKFLRAQAESGQRWFGLKNTNKLINGVSRHWTEVEANATTLAKFREFGIDPDTLHGKELIDHLRNIENTLLDSLNEDERILVELLAHRYGHNQVAYLAMVYQLKAQINEMRQRPFLPRKWFGKHQLVVSEKATTGYEVVHKEGFDTIGARDAAFDKINARLGSNRIIQKKELTDTQYVLMGLPKDFLDTAGTELGLEPAQVSRLSDILQPVKQEKLLKDRDLKDLGITGESQDIMRSYADYTWHHANLQTKMLYRKRFNMAIGKLKREVDELAHGGSWDYYRKASILRSMEGTRDYIMAPPNEWHAVRATISLAYLMGNLKTAVANATGLFITYSDLAGRHGPIKGQNMFFQAVYRNSAHVWSKEKNPDYITKGMARAQEEGMLDQTFAYSVAGMANANRLWRGLSRRRATRLIQKDIELAMMPFRMVELFTRRVTFIAAMEEYSQMVDQRTGKKLGFNEAYERSVKKVNGLQNDYTAGNRIPLMRGMASPVTIFMSFAQHAGWHGLGQYEAGQRALIKHEIKEGMRPESDKPTQLQKLHGHTMHMWGVLLFLAGYQGLPFAENMLDVAEWIWRHFGKKSVRQEIREVVTPLENHPHLFARGFSSNVFGLDLSRSVGWGNLLPTGMLVRSQKDNFDEQVGTLALDMAGVTGHTAKFLFDSTIGDKPFDKAMRSAPGLGGNMWNAMDWSKHGVRGPHDGEITRDAKTGLMRELTGFEIWSKAMGFNPSIVSANRELNYESYDRQVFFTTKRSGLMAAIWRGVVQEDKEYEADARKAVGEFNDWLGNDPEWRSLRIDNGQIARYLQGKRKRQRLEEQGKPQNRRFRHLYEDIRGSHLPRDEEDKP